MGTTAPVTIEENVWIGDSAIICKGVTIGENSIIGAGAVVSRDIPANTIAAGNPARVVKELDPGEQMTKRDHVFSDPAGWPASLISLTGPCSKTTRSGIGCGISYHPEKTIRNSLKEGLWPNLGVGAQTSNPRNTIRILPVCDPHLKNRLGGKSRNVGKFTFALTLNQNTLFEAVSTVKNHQRKSHG